MKKSTPKNKKILSANKSKEYNLIKNTIEKNQEFFQLLLKHELFEIAEKWNKLFEFNASTIISMAEMLEENKIKYSENMNKLIIYTLEQHTKNLDKLSSYKKHLNKDSKEIDLFFQATEIYKTLQIRPRGQKSNKRYQMERALKQAAEITKYLNKIGCLIVKRFEKHLKKQGII